MARRCREFPLPEVDVGRRVLRQHRVSMATRQRVIEKNGGEFVEEFVILPGLGSKRERRYRFPIRDDNEP